MIIQSNFTLSRDLFDWCADSTAAVRSTPRRPRPTATARWASTTTTTRGAGGAAAAQRLRLVQGAVRHLRRCARPPRDYAPPQWVGLKFFNVYGPNEDHKGAMKSVVCQIWPKVGGGRQACSCSSSHHPDYQDGGQLRDFVYVARRRRRGRRGCSRTRGVNGVFNLGSGKARSFKDLADGDLRAPRAREPDIEYIDMPRGDARQVPVLHPGRHETACAPPATTRR